jgi:acetyl esterase/lipase
VLRESAPQLAMVGLVVLAILLLIGAAGKMIGVIALAIVALAALSETRQGWLAHRSTSRIDEALDGIEAPSDDAPRIPRSHLVIPPLAFVTRGVKRTRGVKFAEFDGMRLRLDIYRPADDDPDDHDVQPAVIQVHGGGWLAGSRYEQGIPLLNHLAAIGWVGFNIDYRLSPQATFPDHIVDVKRAIAWVRDNAEELGIDPKMICLTGGSAGGHLTALAALTPGDPDFQPGFEEADTSVQAAVPFYGVYDLTDSNGFYYPELRDYVFEKLVFKRPFTEAGELYRSASPLFRIHADAPPFLVIHGEKDTLVPVEDARFFAERLREASREDVRYVELAGAEHAFDLWPSERTARISEGIGRFLTAVAKSEGRGPDDVEVAGARSA